MKTKPLGKPQGQTQGMRESNITGCKRDLLDIESNDPPCLPWIDLVIYLSWDIATALVDLR